MTGYTVLGQRGQMEWTIALGQSRLMTILGQRE